MESIGRVIGSTARDDCMDAALELKQALRHIDGMFKSLISDSRTGRALGTLLAKDDCIHVVPKCLANRALITEFSRDIDNNPDGGHDNVSLLIGGECALTMGVTEPACAFMASIATSDDLGLKCPDNSTVAWRIARESDSLHYYSKLLTVDHLLDCPFNFDPVDTFGQAAQRATFAGRSIDNDFPAKLVRDYYRRKAQD